MKKLKYLFLLLSLVPSAIFGQIFTNGDGSQANPYSGTLLASSTLSGTVYINGDIIIDSYKLTISPGTTIIFDVSISFPSIYVSSTGAIDAQGTAGNVITFTSAAGTNWAHISFLAGTTGISTFKYCIIEHGDATQATDLWTNGGGISCSFNYLTISNTIIRNNTATNGGGLFIGSNYTPLIENSIFVNNNASRGGGVYMNSSGNAKFYNCVFASNTAYSGSTKGSDIYYKAYNTTIRPQFYNTISWGSSTSLYAFSTNITDFNNCAIQGYTTGYTNCINLNAVNGDPAGPNFVNPGTDYSIIYISPCRDAGISTGAPATDFLGKGRVGNYDIGAYELQYSRWNGSANDNLWATASNWDASVVPVSGTSDVIIPNSLAHYPIISPGPNFTLGAGKIMVLSPGAKATVGSFTNNGSLTLQSDATSGAASFIADSYSGNDATVELFLTGGEAGGTGTKTYRWHYISTPIPSLAVSTFAPTYTKNVAKYYDDRVSGNLSTGWVNYYGYIYSTGGTDPVRQFSSLLPGIGYDYYSVTDNKYTFSGQLNTSDVTMSLSFAVNDGVHGFNLLGNPFSSGLDWSAITGDPSFPATTSKTVYFTRDNTQCSFVGGVGIPGDVTGIIPPMQGFFVKTYATGNSLKIPSSARTQTGIHATYKGDVIVPLVRLSITENGITDETVVRFDDAAKSGVDYDFDAIKMFISTTSTQIYSSLGGTNYSINGLPFPTPSIEIPIVVNFLTTGNHSISATQLQGLDNYSVTLTDISTGFIANLRTTPVLTFSAAAGTISDRFVLKISTITTGTENPSITNGTFNIYPSSGYINIQTLSDDWDGKTGSVKVQELTGKVISTMDNITFSKNSLTTVPANFTNGIYMVELQSGLKRYVGKVVIR